MEERNYTVYCHENKTNGKKYFGITSRVPHRRFGNNGNGYRPRSEKKTKFWMAISKYGWDNFNHIILLENINKSTARELEKYFIKKYNTYSNGYNGTLGGETTWNKNMLQCYNPNTLIKMKESHLGKSLSVKQKEKISNHSKKMWESRTPKDRNTIAIKISNKMIGQLNHQSKKVVCEDIIFNTISELENKYNYSHSLGRYLIGTRPMPQKWLDRGLRYYNPETDKDLPIYVDTKDKV